MNIASLYQQNLLNLFQINLKKRCYVTMYKVYIYYYTLGLLNVRSQRKPTDLLLSLSFYLIFVTLVFTIYMMEILTVSVFLCKSLMPDSSFVQTVSNDFLDSFLLFVGNILFILIYRLWFTVALTYIFKNLYNIYRH